MGKKDPDLFFRGLYYQMTFAYFEKDLWLFQKAIMRFEEFRDEMEESLNMNSRAISFVYLNLSRLNLIFLTKHYQDGPKLIQQIEEQLPEFEPHVDVQRILLFYYKFACINFCLGNYDQTLKYLNEIIHHKMDLLKDDLHTNARLLQLICHFELEEYDFMSDYLIPSTSRSLGKSKFQGTLPKITLNLLKTLAKTPKSNQLAAFKKFQPQLLNLLDQPIEQKAALYLDIPLWLEKHLSKEEVKV